MLRGSAESVRKPEKGRSYKSIHCLVHKDCNSSICEIPIIKYPCSSFWYEMMLKKDKEV